MKKRFSLLLAAISLSMLLIFTGCGEGSGAEDTGPDGMVGGNTTSTTTTTDTDTNTTTPSDNGLVNDARDLVEDILPGGNVTRQW